MSEFIKCSGCNCLFLTIADRDRHIGKFGYNTHVDTLHEMHKKMEYGDAFGDPLQDEEEKSIWTPSKFGGGGEICLAEKLPQLKAACYSQGHVSDAHFTYKLCGQSGKWLKRFPISFGK